MRLDRWLFVARWFKTRSDASTAVARGRVTINGSKAKPAKLIRELDTLVIARAAETFEVIVTGLAPRRLPPSGAKNLYRETDHSVKSRELAATRNALLHLTVPLPGAKPDKRARRQWARLNSDHSDV